jgi:cytochrome c556
MLGSDYLLGYSQGRSSAEDERETNALVARVIYGRRPVQVDQSYLDQLHQLVQKFRADSDHNFDKADLFHREALEWKADADRYEARAAALQAQVDALQAQLAERTDALDQAQAAIAEQLAAHQTTHDEKWGLNLFRLIATWLINAHIAGRSDRPAFAELRDMAKDVTDAIERGEPFRGYQDEPEKKARLQALLEELLRP